METLAFLILFQIFAPYTVSGDFYYCNGDACPKINCAPKSWEYRGYDMNGRKYLTCRNLTKMGVVIKDMSHWLVVFGKHFANEKSEKQSKEVESE